MKADKILIFIAGICIGAGASAFFYNKKAHESFQEGFNEAKQRYRVDYTAPKPVEQDIPEEKIPVEENLKEVAHISNQFNYTVSVTKSDYTEERIQLIDQSIFLALNGHEKKCLIVWTDFVWTDDNEQIIKETDLLGAEFTDGFAHSEADCCYIYDSQNNIDYEIEKRKVSYAWATGMEEETDLEE